MNISLRVTIYISFCLSLVLLLSACSKPGENEGLIRYDVKFNDEEKEVFPIIEILPNTMNYYFKNGSTVSEISFLGLFRTAYISNLESEENSVLFYYMPKGYYVSTKFGEKTIGFDPMPGIILTETDEVKNILGFSAHKVNVSFEHDTIEPYDIWYTKEFNIENPNWHTPYKDIDGVLLDYRIKMKGISMHLTISSFSDNQVDSSRFVIPQTYTRVTPEEMDDIFDRYLQMF